MNKYRVVVPDVAREFRNRAVHSTASAGCARVIFFSGAVPEIVFDVFLFKSINLLQ